MLLEVLIENLALGAVKLINLPLKNEVSYHSNQTSEFNLPPNASDKTFCFYEGLNISPYKKQRAIPLGLASKQVDI